MRIVLLSFPSRDSSLFAIILFRTNSIFPPPCCFYLYEMVEISVLQYKIVNSGKRRLVWFHRRKKYQ